MSRTKMVFYVLLWLLSSSAFSQTETGKASYYAKKFSGRPTASGEKYNPKLFTAAHRTLPFGTVVKVINLTNKREVIVTVNDRGPFIKSRIIDLSEAAADKLGFIMDGVTEVRVEILEEGLSGAFLNDSGETFQPDGWYIQLASFSQHANAMNFAKFIRETPGLTTFTEEIVVSNQPVYRIHLGPYSREEAEKVFKQVKPNYAGAILKEPLN